MEKKGIYTHENCSKTGFDFSIKGQVVVLESGVLSKGDNNQLFYCTGGDGADNNPIGDSVFTISLANGEISQWNRRDVIGTLKPELLPDSAKLQLSQIRPEGAMDLNKNEPRYSGYSFLPDGRYAAGVWLCNEKEVMDYIEIQKPYQHRIMICDRNDFCVLEMQNQTLIYPTPEELAAFSDREGGMGMDMK